MEGGVGLREKAKVVAERNDEAKVEIIRTSACDHCRGCKIGTDKKVLQIWVKNPINAKVGQTVEVELQTNMLLSAIFIAYVIPLIAFIIGISLGYKIGEYNTLKSREIFSFICGIIGIGISYLWIHFFSKKPDTIKKYTSAIINVLE